MIQHELAGGSDGYPDHMETVAVHSVVSSEACPEITHIWGDPCSL